MNAPDMNYRDPGEVTNGCPQCLAWKAEADRAAYLLQTLAEDHFPDQAAFDRWTNEQMQKALGSLPGDEP